MPCFQFQSIFEITSSHQSIKYPCLFFSSVLQSLASKTCAAVLLSPAHRCTSLTNCPSPWPSSPIWSLSPWPTAWMQSWCMDAPTQWPTVRPQVVPAVAAARAIASSAQSPSGLHRAPQRTHPPPPPKGTVRYHSDTSEQWVALMRPELILLLLPEVTRPEKSMESYPQSSSETDTAVFTLTSGNRLG